MAILVNAAFAFLVSYLIYYALKNWRYYYLLKKLPSPKGHLLFGNTLQVVGITDDAIAARKLIKPVESSSLICFWIFHLPYVFLTKYSSAEVILSSTTEIEKSSIYGFLKPWLGLGLLTSSGNRWRSHRKLLTPSFHFHILKNFIPIFNEQSQTLVNLLSKNAGKGIFDVYPYITNCTLDIICEAAMGKRIDSQLGKNADYLEALTNVANMVMYRTLHPWLMIPWIFELSPSGKIQKKSLKILHSFTEKVIKERREEFEKHRAQIEEEVKNKENDCHYVYGRKNQKAFLDTLLEASYKGEINLTDEMIREETDTFMFEGHDTTAVNISWVIFFLGWCPSAQEVVHQELDRVFENSDRSVNIEDISEMKYLEAVIKETLRLVPSVQFFGRRLIKETDVGGYIFPRDTEVLISPYLIGIDPNIYQNPENFDPTRFLHDNIQNRHPYAYVPFSAGPRNCIGQKFAMMEEKVILANVLRQFEIKAHNSVESVRAKVDLVYRPNKGMHISLERRHAM